MTNEQLGVLRRRAGELRLRVATGVVAVAAARDAVVRVRTGLQARIERGLSEETLKDAWERALAQAGEVLPEAGTAEVTLAAVVDLLHQHGKAACDILTSYAEEIEGNRRAAEGRAQGLEEAAEQLLEKPAAPE